MHIHPLVINHCLSENQKPSATGFRCSRKKILQRLQLQSHPSRPSPGISTLHPIAPRTGRQCHCRLSILPNKVSILHLHSRKVVFLIFMSLQLKETRNVTYQYRRRASQDTASHRQNIGVERQSVPILGFSTAKWLLFSSSGGARAG